MMTYDLFEFGAEDVTVEINWVYLRIWFALKWDFGICIHVGWIWCHFSLTLFVCYVKVFLSFIHLHPLFSSPSLWLPMQIKLQLHENVNLIRLWIHLPQQGNFTPRFESYIFKEMALFVKILILKNRNSLFFVIQTHSFTF